jgi:16S rRNA (guanine527-N7)-methyltransferase
MAAEDSAPALARLVRAHGLPAAAGPALAELLSLLAGERHVPTSVRSPERALEVHIADALAALGLAEVRRARTIADVGAGAGILGLVLASALPATAVRMVESQQRKCAFIEAAIARMGLANARVLNTRAELWGEGLEANELVTARALGPQPVVLEYAAPLLALGGHLVDWRGRRDPDEEAAAALAASELGLGPARVVAVQPFPAAEHRHLHVFQKLAPTPDRFPRRPGLARKRPLGRRGG